MAAGLVALLALGGLLAPIPTHAQPPGKVHRVGYLYPGPARGLTRVNSAFLQGLGELGWVEGKNVAIEYRFAEGKFDRLADLAAERARLKVDVILASTTPAAKAAKN